MCKDLSLNLTQENPTKKLFIRNIDLFFIFLEFAEFNSIWQPGKAKYDIFKPSKLINKLCKPQVQW